MEEFALPAIKCFKPPYSQRMILQKILCELPLLLSVLTTALRFLIVLIVNTLRTKKLTARNYIKIVYD